MPELPEVETIRRQLEEELKGCTFVEVTTGNTKMFRPSVERVVEAIKGEKINSVDRRAKLLIFNLSESKRLLFHLKLTGRLLVRNPSDTGDDYTHAVFKLTCKGGRAQGIKELRFADARKFGFVKLVTDREEMIKLLAGYGPEPFKGLTESKFLQILGSSKRSVKLILLDQEKISGIGNIYANDALWLARMDPRMVSNKVTKELSKRLYDSVLNVLRKGLKYGGASDQWYRQVHGEEGQYQEHFLVYGRNGERCQRCGTEIKRMFLGGRGTFFCPKCQRS